MVKSLISFVNCLHLIPVINGQSLRYFLAQANQTGPRNHAAMLECWTRIYKRTLISLPYDVLHPFQIIIHLTFYFKFDHSSYLKIYAKHHFSCCGLLY